MPATVNPDFLNLSLFEDAFLQPLEELKGKVGVIIFEFSTFYPSTGITLPVFLSLLDPFLARLPSSYSYRRGDPERRFSDSGLSRPAAGTRRGPRAEQLEPDATARRTTRGPRAACPHRSPPSVRC